MEDDLEAQLVQQLAEVWRLRAEREAQERERRENEYRAQYQEEQQQRKHEAAAQRVAETKMIQRQVRMPEASRSGRNGESDVSSPSPSPAYIRLIGRQAARVSGSETEIEDLLMESETGKSRGHPERPVWRLCRPQGVLRP